MSYVLNCQWYAQDTINVCYIFSTRKRFKYSIFANEIKKIRIETLRRTQFDWRLFTLHFPSLATNNDSNESCNLHNHWTILRWFPKRKYIREYVGENTKASGDSRSPSLEGRDSHDHVWSAPLFDNHTSVLCTTWRPRREWARTSIDGLASCRTAPSWRDRGVGVRREKGACTQEGAKPWAIESTKGKRREENREERGKEKEKEWKMVGIFSTRRSPSFLLPRNWKRGTVRAICRGRESARVPVVYGYVCGSLGPSNKCVAHIDACVRAYLARNYRFSYRWRPPPRKTVRKTKWSR